MTIFAIQQDTNLNSYIYKLYASEKKAKEEINNIYNKILLDNKGNIKKKYFCHTQGYYFEIYLNNNQFFSYSIEEKNLIE